MTTHAWFQFMCCEGEIAKEKFIRYHRNPTVFELIRRNQWSIVVEILRTSVRMKEYSKLTHTETGENYHFTDGCVYVDPSKRNSILHQAVLCKNNLSLTDFQFIMDVYPSLINQTNSMAETPLHLACMTKTSARFIRMLLSSGATQSVSMLNYDGRSPLHLACLNPDTDIPNKEEIIRLLLDVDQSWILIPDYNGETPIELFWQSCVKDLDESCSFYLQQYEQPVSFEDFELMDWRAAAVTHCAQMLICTAYTQLYHCKTINYCSKSLRVDMNESIHPSSISPLRAAIGMEEIFCPEVFIQIMILINADNCQAFDVNGDLPLHVVSSLPYSSNTLHTIEALISVYTNALSIPNRSGYLPLEIALRSNNFEWNNIIKLMIELYPVALEQIRHYNDFSETFLVKVLPLLTTQCSLSCIYQVLNNRPSILQVLLNQDISN